MMDLVLIYSKEVPTKPGAYWCRRNKGNGWVEMFYDNPEQGIGFEDDGHRFSSGWVTPQDVGDEWAGPIPEPEENEELSDEE